jgi:MoaA/NifB/PqqE/SkfB family radical SAM enzyme
MSRLNYIAARLADQIDSLVAIGRYAASGHELRNKLAASFPGLSVETTNICNANCTFCAYQYQERLTGVMAPELFEKLIDQYCEVGGGPISLTPTVGDPLVDPLILERIKYARSKPAIEDIGMTSNLILLEKVGGQKLIDAGLTSLSVSTTAFDPEMYKRIYRSDMFVKVYRSILDFARLNNSLGRPVKFVIGMRTDRPLQEVFASEKYKEVAALVGPENIAANFFFDNWSGRISQADLTGTMRLRNQGAIQHFFLNVRRPRISPCAELYSGPMVYWDGKVGACGCRDVDASELVIGNISHQHIADIWFGEEVKKLRREFLSDDVQPICKDCTHYNNLSLLLKKSESSYLERALSKRKST